MSQSLRKFRSWLRRDRFDAVQPWSRRAARFFDPHFTANRMTLLGLVLCVPSTICFAYDAIAIATAFTILSFLTDWFDGSLGRYQEEIYRNAHDLKPISRDEEARLTLVERINLRGVTHLGRSLDPLVDKVRMFTFLLTIGYDIIDTWMIWGIIAIGIVLTFMRPLKQWMKLDHAGSNRFGKYKIFAEIVGMSALVFLSPWQNWAYYHSLVNTCFELALALAVASLVGHVVTGLIAYRKRDRSMRTRTELASNSPRP